MKKSLVEEKVNTVDIKHFISLIRKYKNPTEVSDLMFTELIDKIVVYEAEVVGKARTQKVDIYFNYVGQVDIANTEEELAEIKEPEEAVCGSTYWPTHSQQKFCFEECKKVNHNKKTLEFYHKKQKEKALCKDLLQTKEQVSDTNSLEITIMPA
ncbi:DUF4368 domain-containing protein [Treponema sp. OMZ 857]|uniref:DUF4368 domain-containing protein n=1 Tax=Treponema sp. OMZ 857 TaxID=1643513 RepID=UPI0020A4E335|nr:DUF4368 domain-containing protein [Treponema sp. OMZ 857]